MKLKTLIKNFLSEENNFDFYPDAVVVIDELNNITRWNKKAKEIFGYTREEMIGRNIEILFDSGMEKIYECTEDNKINILASKNNLDEVIFVEVACSDFPTQNGIMITARDVTKNQKVIEKLLIEYETATRINSNKGKFVFGLVNNLKTPLHSLVGFSQGLIDGVCGELSEKQSKYVAIINKNANSLLETVDALLELSGLESGNIQLNLKVFDLVKNLNNICSRVKQAAIEKGLEFEADFSRITRKNIYSDEAMVSRVFSSIVENAVKFTDIGSVKVKAKYPDIETLKSRGITVPDGFTEKSYILFSVSDTGIGLSPEDMYLIFDEYVQANSPLTKKYGGTGLKLALSKKIMACLGGVMWVESELGQGSTFSFIIPTERLERTQEPVEG